MKLKNRFYNDYLKSLVLTQGSTEPRSTESKQMQELIYMNSHIQRFYNGNYFSYAVFETLGGFRYKVTTDARIYKIKDGTLKEVKAHIMANMSTTYTALRYMYQGEQHNIHMHLVMMVCAYPDFLDAYLSNNLFRVNHCMIAEDDNDRSDLYDMLSNLEICTHSTNLRHGRFCHKYGIYNTHIESEDLDELLPLMIPLSDDMNDELRERVKRMNKAAVNNFYMERGLALWV